MWRLVDKWGGVWVWVSSFFLVRVLPAAHLSEVAAACLSVQLLVEAYLLAQPEESVCL